MIVVVGHGLVNGPYSRTTPRVIARRAGAPMAVNEEVTTRSTTAKPATKLVYPSRKELDSNMDWKSQWYPVGSTRTLKKNVPNPIRLLENALVAWQSPSGWKVAVDRCPHRGAPLSYGRLEANSTLTCSYHGWQFDAEGQTTYVPTKSKVGCSACLRVHPAVVCEHGLLWVWPQACVPGSPAEAAALAKPLPTDHLPPPGAVITDWTVNRVPVPWASLLENTLDDAHGVHAHHGFAGLDRVVARPAFSTRSGERGHTDSFEAWVDVSGPMVGSDGSADPSDPNTWVNSYHFRAPHRTTVRFGPSYRAEGFIVPAAYDETLLVSAAFSVPEPGRGAHFIKSMQQANPFLTAVLHRLGTTVVCQDAVLAEADGLDNLRGERWTGERAKGGLTDSDGAVIRLRTWMRRTGGPPLMPASDDVKRWKVRRELSVWEMHTRDCPTCRRAHDDSAATAKVLLAFSIAAAASGLLPAALALLLNSEISRQTSRWFETYDVKFDR